MTDLTFGTLLYFLTRLKYVTFTLGDVLNTVGTAFCVECEDTDHFLAKVTTSSDSGGDSPLILATKSLWMVRCPASSGYFAFSIMPWTRET